MPVFLVIQNAWLTIEIANAQDWDGHEQPVHVGLDPEIKEAFVEQLKVWRTQCSAWVKTKSYCLTKPKASSIRNSMMLARRSEYTQEVRFLTNVCMRVLSLIK